MSRRNLVPTLRKHANGSAYCKWRGQYHYFGPWESARLDEFRAFQKSVETASQPGPLAGSAHSPTVADLLAAYIKDRLAKYGAPDDAENLKKYKFRWKQAFQPVLARYAALPVSEFGPKAFKAVRQQLAKGNRSRTYVNDLAAEIRLAMQWGVSEEMVPAEVYQAVKAVKPLRRGELAGVPEGRDVQPVDIAVVRATLPFLTGPVAAIVELMTLTVSRPGEIAAITAEAIDKQGPGGAWVYWLNKHKNSWRGKKRFVVFGPEAQAVLARFWRPRGPFFVNDRTGRIYTSEQIRKAIEWACKRAGLPYWHPYQIRHATYSATSQQHGVEAAALLAGHTSTKMAERYDHSKVAKAAKYAS